MMGIIAGLNSSSISRLKKTWACVPKEYVTLFENEYTAMFANNYKKLRESVKVSPPRKNICFFYSFNIFLACLPYLGVYLGDLTFIGNFQ